jgi:hypothetical protein
MTTSPLSPYRALRLVGAASAWVLAPALGWAVVPYFLWNWILPTYRAAAIALLGYLLVGLLVGAATGLGQGLSLRLAGRPAAGWLLASLLGYGLALPGGLLIGLLFASIMWQLNFGSPLLPLTEPGSVTYYAFPGSLVFAGFLAGVCQWAALRSHLDRPTRAMQMLWVLGAWLGIGLGLFVGGTIATRLVGTDAPASGAYGVVWGAAWGSVVGLVSAGVLWILRREARRTGLRAVGGDA